MPDTEVETEMPDTEIPDAEIHRHRQSLACGSLQIPGEGTVELVLDFSLCFDLLACCYLSVQANRNHLFNLGRSYNRKMEPCLTEDKAQSVFFFK